MGSTGTSIDILLLHPVSDWSLARMATACARRGWRLTIATIEGSDVGAGVPTLHEWIRVPALTDDPDELSSQIGDRHFDAVVAGNEFAVVAADVLARELGVYHNDVAKIAAARNKPLMRSTFASAGVPQPQPIAHFATLDQSRAFDWSTATFPVIVKPVDMAMSLFVRKCESRDQVEDTIARMLDFRHSRLTNYAFTPGALVEEFVDGPEFSIECVISAGAVVAHSFTQKLVCRPPSCYEIGHIVGSDVPSSSRAALLTACHDIAAAWGMPRGIMHVEFKLAEGRISIIEAGARPAGDHVPELVEFQYGFSLEEAFLTCRLGRDWAPPEQPGPGRDTWHAIRFEFDERTAAERPGVVEVLRTEGNAGGLVAGAEPFSVNSRTGYSLLRSHSLAELDDYVRVV